MAAAVVGSAAASAQLPAKSFKEAGLVPVTGFQLSETSINGDAVKSVNSGVVGQTTRKAAPSRSAENVVDFNFGEYLITFYDEETPFNTRLNPAIITKDETNVTDSTVVISQFYYSDAMDMSALTVFEDITFSDGTYTLPVLKIPGDGQTPYLTLEGQDGTTTTYYLYLCSPSQSKIYMDDLEWVIDESGELWFLYNNSVSLGFFTESPSGGFSGYFMDPGISFYKKNAEMTAMFYDGEGSYVEASCPVWTYVTHGSYTNGEPYTAVFAAGWGACGEPFHFMIEDLGEDQYVAAAYDQVGWETEAGDAYFCDVVFDDQGNPDFYWYIDGQEKIWMVANIGVDGEGNTVFSQDGDWCLFNTDQGIVTTWKEGTTVLDYYIGVGEGQGGDEPDGIEAIDSENAPAEYYNLQGVKVANPTPGQLYIVKQGSKVSKVIR
ncbi:MAG: hypothetical protein K2N16_01140 [Muribaculaceae bacterium]|nr:hypothetical protein [Muribaculaceae bacterium]